MISRMLVVSPDRELQALIAQVLSAYLVELSFVATLEEARRTARTGHAGNFVLLDPLTTRRAWFAGETVSLRPYAQVAALLLDPAGRIPLGVELPLSDFAGLRALCDAFAAPAEPRWLERCA